MIPRPHSNPLGRVRLRLADPGAGQFTPVQFQTTLEPTIDHTGLTNRPGYNAATPLSQQFRDPMNGGAASGIWIARVTGDQGDTIFEYITGSAVDSGLVWPLSLRNDNSASAGRVFNSDGSLLFLDQSRGGTGDAGNAARSVLVDTTGAIAGAPYRVLRAAGSSGLGIGAGVYWFWDPLNPLRAYILRSDGSIDEWWPVGGDGHAVDEVNTIPHLGALAGYDTFTNTQAHAVACSFDGQWYMQHCVESSTGHWGGRRRNLLTGAADSFLWTEPHFTDNNDPTGDRTAQTISPLGNFTHFHFSGHMKIVDAVTNALVFDTDDALLPANNFSHTDWVLINGEEWLIGVEGGAGLYGINATTGNEVHAITNLGMPNPSHCSCRNYADLAETYGAVGGMTSGNRYFLHSKSETTTGSRGIRGFRLGPNDLNQCRYLAHHRGVRESGGGMSANEHETHLNASPNGRQVVFNSNWHGPGVETDYQQDAYVIMLPDAWWSPNNDGSAV